MKNSLIALLIIIHPVLNLHSQDTDFREMFLTAESYFLFEEFNEALPLYLRIHRHNPDNDNVNFKIGVCFLNDPYQKNKSVSYLEKAAENINPKYKENNFKEKAAPPEALFYLGNAYRINNQLEKAKKQYQIFLTRMDRDVYDAELVEDQIESCNIAQKLMKKPIDFDLENLGRKINTRFADENPVVSGDESKMAFISKLQFYDAVFYTEKVDGEWAPPRNIVPELGVDGDVYPTSLSHNGTVMYIYRNDNFIGNLYSSKLVNGKWTSLKKLNENINTRFWESHASVSKDGKTLYFSSNRRGGYGGLDIYRSEKQENGEWGPAVNLGPKVNSKYNDDTPFISDSGNKLFFSSYGHYNMGGYDIFMSMKNSIGEWTEPLNIGYPVNTTDDDQFFVPVKDGQIAYYARFDSQGGFGKHDIFRYKVYTPDYPRMFSIKGYIDLQGIDKKPEEIDISVVKQGTNDTLSFTHPDEELKFEFEVPAGKYDVIFDGEKFRKEILRLDVTPETPRTGLLLETPVTLMLLPPEIPVKEMEGMLEIREDSIIYVEEGEEASIRYNAEKGNKVVVDVFQKGELISSDTIEINRKRQKYEFDPEPGESDVKITLFDNDGNSITKSVRVIDLETPAQKLSEEYTEELAEDEGSDLEEEETEESLRGEIKDSDIQGILEALQNNSSGDLGNYLGNFNPVAIGIETRDQLIDHLYEASESLDFSSDDVSKLLQDTGLLSDLEIFIRELASLSAPGLSKYLLESDPEEMNIQTEKELIDHLFEIAPVQDFTKEDIVEALSKYYGDKNINRLIEELLRHSEGPLHDYLKELDTEQENISNVYDLYRHLVENAENNTYSQQDVINMFEKYFAPSIDSPLSILDKLRNSTTGEIHDFLMNIDDDKISGMDRKEFYDFLVKKAAREGIDIIDILANALDSEGVNPKNFKLYLTDYGSEGVKETTGNLPSNLRTSGGILRQLAELSNTRDDISRDELIDLALDYLKNKDLYDLYYDLLRNSSNGLHLSLQNIDIKNSGFRDRKELIDFLIKETEKGDFSTEDIYNALTRTYEDAYILDMIEDLIRLAEGSIREALLDLEPVKEKISDLNGIINYLLKNTLNYGYTEKDVYTLIERYLSEDMAAEESKLLPEPDKAELKEKFNRGAIWTAGILLVEGLLILILILLARRKKKKKEKEILSN